jgi:hypothetical protein
MIRHLPPRALALAALLVWAPLPFGSVAPFPATLLLVATLGALILAVWTVPEPGEPDPGLRPRGIFVAAAAVAAIALLGGLQSLPAPTVVTRFFAPESVRLARQTTDLTGGLAGHPDAGHPDAGHPNGAADGAVAGSDGSDGPDGSDGSSRSHRSAARADAAGISTPLSLAPEASRSAALDWLLPAAAFLAAARIGSSRRVRRALGGALLVAATVQIVIGVALWISRSDTLWGLVLGASVSRVRGSFINPDHTALFLEIALAVAFAWLWWAARRTFLDAEHAEDRLLRVGPPALAFLLVFAGLVLTGSRAALAAALVAMAVQGAVVGSRRGRRWLLAVGLAVGLAGIVALLALGAEGTFARLSLTSVDEVTGGVRVEAAGATFDLFRRFPLTGSGLGSFQAAFPLVQRPTTPGLWRHAHSDWIELLATTGMLGAAILAIGLFFYGRRLHQVIVHGERSEGRAAGLAALGALVAVGLHSCVDFGLTMPANAFALAVVTGAAAATRLEK